MDIELTHNGVPVTILDGPYIENQLPTLQAIEHYKRTVASLDNLRWHAAEKLLKLYNDTWVDEDIGPVDDQGFVARLINPVVQLYDEIGYILVYFEDSGLFAGHYIAVTVENGIPTSVRLS